MSERSTSDSSFKSEVSAIFGELGEIVALFRFHAGAGNRSYEIFHDPDSLFQRIGELPPSTDVIIFKQHELRLRGTVDPAFAKRVLDTIPDGADWVVARTTLVTMGSMSWYHVLESNSHKDLADELSEGLCLGHPVAVGLEPKWHGETASISALVPGEDGTVRRGIY